MHCLYLLLLNDILVFRLNGISVDSTVTRHCSSQKKCLIKKREMHIYT